MIVLDYKKELEIVDLTSRIHPYKYYIPFLEEVNIYATTTFEDLLRAAWEKGYNHGKKVGEKYKIQQIKSILEIENDI